MADGQIRQYGKKIHLFKKILERKSLNCADSFLNFGLEFDEYETEELLKIAIEECHHTVTENLLRRISLQNTGTFLHYAAKHDNAEACKTILDLQDSDPNIAPREVVQYNPHDSGDGSIQIESNVFENNDAEGNSVLHVAAKFASKNTLEVLIEKQSHLLETKNSKGRTPIQEAAINQKIENVRFLVRKGANLTSVDKDGQSALQTIISKTPVAMEEFESTRLDAGIVLSEDRSAIELSFGPIIEIPEKSTTLTEMSLFEALSESILKKMIEHPLIQVYLHDKFNSVKYIFYIAHLVPHLIFSGI